ncbi:hypothetical protein MY11210_002097 [Beauveria gryllotalpidicola]
MSFIYNRLSSLFFSRPRTTEPETEAQVPHVEDAPDHTGLEDDEQGAADQRERRVALVHHVASLPENRFRALVILEEKRLLEKWNACMLDERHHATGEERADMARKLVWSRWKQQGLCGWQCEQPVPRGQWRHEGASGAREAATSSHRPDRSREMSRPCFQFMYEVIAEFDHLHFLSSPPRIPPDLRGSSPRGGAGPPPASGRNLFAEALHNVREQQWKPQGIWDESDSSWDVFPGMRWKHEQHPAAVGGRRAAAAGDAESAEENHFFALYGSAQPSHLPTTVGFREYMPTEVARKCERYADSIPALPSGALHRRALQQMPGSIESLPEEDAESHTSSNDSDMENQTPSTGSNDSDMENTAPAPPTSISGEPRLGGLRPADVLAAVQEAMGRGPGGQRSPVGVVRREPSRGVFSGESYQRRVLGPLPSLQRVSKTTKRKGVAVAGPSASTDIGASPAASQASTVVYAPLQSPFHAGNGVSSEAADRHGASPDGLVINKDSPRYEDDFVIYEDSPESGDSALHEDDSRNEDFVIHEDSPQNGNSVIRNDGSRDEGTVISGDTSQDENLAILEDRQRDEGVFIREDTPRSAGSPVEEARIELSPRARARQRRREAVERRALQPLRRSKRNTRTR